MRLSSRMFLMGYAVDDVCSPQISLLKPAGLGDGMAISPERALAPDMMVLHLVQKKGKGFASLPFFRFRYN
jgi:hypothetical protein